MPLTATLSGSLILGQPIRTERKRQRLTLEQLAAIAGVGVRFVRELESGKESCRLGLALGVLQTLCLKASVAVRGANTRVACWMSLSRTARRVS